MLPRAPEYWHMWCWSTRSLYPSPWKVISHLWQRSGNVKMWFWSKCLTFCKWRRGNQKTAGWGSSRSHGAPGGVLQYHRYFQRLFWKYHLLDLIKLHVRVVIIFWICPNYPIILKSSFRFVQIVRWRISTLSLTSTWMNSCVMLVASLVKIGKTKHDLAVWICVKRPQERLLTGQKTREQPHSIHPRQSSLLHGHSSWPHRHTANKIWKPVWTYFSNLGCTIRHWVLVIRSVLCPSVN